MNELDRSKLKTISLDELEKIGVCQTDLLYFFPQSKKFVVLLKAGEYVLPKLIDKYRERGFKSLYVNPKFDLKDFEQWDNWWNKFQTCQTGSEYEIHKIRHEFIQFSKSILLDAKVSGSLLAFMSSTHKMFNGLSKDFTSQYAEKNYTLFKRSMLVASLSLLVVISLGYTDFSFLKDLYNTIMLLTYNLADEKFTVLMKNAFDLESVENGLGVSYLKEKSPKEVNHLLVEDEIADNVYNYTNKHIKDLIYFYHQSFQLPDSNDKLLDSEMVDWVSAVIFVDRIVEYDDFDFNSDDAKGYLKKIIDKRISMRFLKSYGFRKLKNLFSDYWKFNIGETRDNV